MKDVRVRFPAWVLAAVLAVSLFVLSAGTVFAGSGGSSANIPPPATGLKITGYTIEQGGVPNTGSILKGALVTVKVDLLDTRVTSGTVSPVATLNTASFSLGRAADLIQPGDVPADPNGASYSVTFNNAVYTGVGNSFAFDITYANPDGAYEKVTAEIIFNQATPPAESEDPAVVVKGTGFVLKDARYGDGAIYAGQPFTLSATILATSGDNPVENVSVSFAPPEQLTLSDGSSVAYIGTMAPGASAPVSVTLLPGANITEGSYTIAMDVNGVNQKTGEAVKATMSISVPILQPERFEIFNTQLPTDMTAGMDDGMGFGSVTLVNQGKGAVSNVSAEIVGDGLSADEGRQYIGNVNGGEQKSADFNIHADTPGQINALVIITYENVRGEQKTLEHAFTINVMEGMPPDINDPGMIDPGMMLPEETNAGLQPWMWIVIGAVACAVVVTVILIRRRKKRLAATEAALDYTEDDEE